MPRRDGPLGNGVAHRRTLRRQRRAVRGRQPRGRWAACGWLMNCARLWRAPESSWALRPPRTSSGFELRQVPAGAVLGSTVVKACRGLNLRRQGAITRHCCSGRPAEGDTSARTCGAPPWLGGLQHAGGRPLQTLRRAGSCRRGATPRAGATFSEVTSACNKRYAPECYSY